MARNNKTADRKHWNKQIKYTIKRIFLEHRLQSYIELSECGEKKHLSTIKGVRIFNNESFKNLHVKSTMPLTDLPLVFHIISLQHSWAFNMCVVYATELCVVVNIVNLTKSGTFWKGSVNERFTLIEV